MESNIQFIGQSGYTDPCLHAIEAILNGGVLPEASTIITWVSRGRPLQQEHLFLFWNWGYFPVTIVPNGFASGYPGEAPKGFSLAICMIMNKGIPLFELRVSEDEFRVLDVGKPSDLLLQKVRATAEKYSSAWDDRIFPDHKNLLSRGKLWQAIHWRNNYSDWLATALANIDDLIPEVAKRLRLAYQTLNKSDICAEWQQTGIQVRDAWVLMARFLCEQKGIDTDGIKADDIRARLAKLKPGDRLKTSCISTFDLSLKIQHDRNVTKGLAQACVSNTIMLMQALVASIYPKSGA